jgi:predicted TIM-barrel fold metal-dependent hydrolase
LENRSTSGTEAGVKISPIATRSADRVRALRRRRAASVRWCDDGASKEDIMSGRLTRRGWLSGVGLGFAAALPARPEARQQAPSAPGAQAEEGLRLQDFRPRSMLSVPAHPVDRAKFPVVDVHTHPTGRARNQGGVPRGEAVAVRNQPADLLRMMDARNLRTLVDLTGSSGSGLAEAVRTFQAAHPGRFVVFTEPSFDRIAEPGYAAWQAEELTRAKAAGARGLKVLKVLGLFLREQIDAGPLVKVDDPRFDPMWEACAALDLPVAIHVSDPAAFFLPVDAQNERYEELHRRPDWSFHGRDFPSNAEILAARDRVLARHPRTTFIGLHVGHSSEDLAAASAALDRFPNLYVDIAARIGELGRQPRASQRFFDRYQDRIVFGTDGPHDALYPIYFRFLETEDEYFDYSPGPIPSQGRWKIYGLGLSDQILRKVYAGNAERLLHLPPAA